MINFEMRSAGPMRSLYMHALMLHDIAIATSNSEFQIVGCSILR